MATFGEVEKGLYGTHWNECPFTWWCRTTLSLAMASSDSKRTPYEQFVGMRLNDGKSGWLYPIHEG